MSEQIFQRVQGQLVPVNGEGSDNASAVRLTGNQVIAGVKTFQDAPQVPSVVEMPSPDVDGNIFTDTFLDAFPADKLNSAVNLQLVLDFGHVLSGDIESSLMGLMTFMGTAINSAEEKAEAAKTLAEGALPGSGGQVTGNIIIGIGDYDADAFKYIRGSAVKDDGSLHALADLIFQNNNSAAKSNAILRVYNRINGTQYKDLRIDMLDDGTAYATCPPPRMDNYGNDIVNMKAMKDYTLYNPAATLTVHVDEVSGSDTAGLNSYRGLSADMPFKTLAGAAQWIRSKVATGQAVFIELHSDVNINNGVFFLQNLGSLAIKSDATKRTVNMTGIGISLFSGTLELTDLILSGSSGCNGFVSVSRNAFLKTGANVEFAGVVSQQALSATAGGIITVANDIDGSLQGKKYSITNGGMIIGASKIPGSEAGYCDAASVCA